MTCRPAWYNRPIHPNSILALLLILAPLCVADDKQTASPAAKLNVFKGQVVDNDLKPVAGAKVYAAKTEGGYIAYQGGNEAYVWGDDDKVLWFFTARNGKGSGKATTRSDGSFTITGLQKGRFSILVVHKDKGITAVSENLPKEDLTIKLPTPTFIEGNFNLPSDQHSCYFGRLETYQDMPWEELHSDSNCFVYISPAVNLDSKGHFKAGPLPVGGQWTLVFNQYVPEGTFLAQILQHPIEIDLGKTNTFNFNPAEHPPLTSFVLDAKGQPLAHTAVSVTKVKSEGTRTESNGSMNTDQIAAEVIYGAVTDGNGQYTIHGISPGTYKLEVKRYAKRVGFG